MPLSCVGAGRCMATVAIPHTKLDCVTMRLIETKLPATHSAAVLWAGQSTVKPTLLDVTNRHVRMQDIESARRYLVLYTR